MHFKAALLTQTGGPLEIADVEIPELRAGDVLVRVMASGLCHTDLEAIQGRLGLPLPLIPGHEGAGIVERVGPGVTSVRPGDHVVCSWNPYCGHCFYCDEAQPILCEKRVAAEPKGFLLDGTTRLRINGENVYHYSFVCSHAQYCVVPESGAVRMPREMPFAQACILGCGVLTGVGAVIRRAQVRAGSSVAVLGCGALGLNVIQGARMAGAEQIIAIDIRDDKLDRARLFGATHTINATGEELVAQVKAETWGRGADYTFEAAGIDHTLQPSLDVTRPGGHVVLLGKTLPSKELPIRWSSLAAERVITRSSYGGVRPNIDLPFLARSYLDGRLLLDELIDERICLEDINAGFAKMEQGAFVRSVIDMKH